MDEDSPEIARLREDIVVHANVRGVSLTLHTTWGLFSPRSVDEGTRLLLDHIEVNPADHGIDLGCGYGPLGLVLARLAPQGRMLLIDKDVVAVEYSRLNATRNGLSNVEARLSNGFANVPERGFDLIASNVPAKTGNELWTLFLVDAYRRLRPGGRLYVVTITGLRRFVERTCGEVFGNYHKLKQGKTYTVALAERPTTAHG